MKKLDIVKEAKIVHVTAAALMFLAGIMFIAWAELTEVRDAVRFLLGGVFIVMGCARVLGYHANDLYRMAFQYDLALGIFCVLFGILIIFSPGKAEDALPYAIGLYVLLDGLLRVQTALEAKAFGMKHWWGLLATSLLLSACGVVVVLGSGGQFLPTNLTYGLALAFDGAENIWNTMGTMRVRVRAKQDKQEQPDEYDKLF
ncbi:MAG: DUF308 domain-containing protein [Clostridia bacterium]|nr:DUF308 domain-containing protein [Clostridia bacterium]